MIGFTFFDGGGGGTEFLFWETTDHLEEVKQNVKDLMIILNKIQFSTNEYIYATINNKSTEFQTFDFC